MNSISITNRDEYDNTSDPAGSMSTSSSSQQNPAATPENSSRHRPSDNVARGGGDDPVGDSDRTGGNNDETNNNNIGDTTASASASASASRPSETTSCEEERLAELRAIMPGVPDEELLQMLRENDRASNNARQCETDAAMAQAATTPNNNAMSSQRQQPSARRSGMSRGGSSNNSHRRSWVPCQPAPSRPGVFRVGGAIESGGNFNIGETNPLELEIKRIEAVSQVQEALNEKLGYDLRESGKYEEMEREYAEGERILAMTGLERREKKVLPTMMVWDAPPVSRASMMKKEPPLPELGEPLPLPLSFGTQGEGMENGGNGDIAVGKFVDTAPDEEEDEQKREEDLDSEAWAGVSVDDSPMGPYDQVVRCWKCRAGLKVHIEVGLVACPRCHTISPATDVANIG